MNKTILKKVKEKKELGGIDDYFILDIIKNYFRKNGIANDREMGEKEIKIIVKDVRNELRKASGQFNLVTKNEREENYLEIKKIISELEVNRILDLGCGLNPLFLADKNYEYYAYDINKNYIDKINNFFIEKNINGGAEIYDLKKIERRDMPFADICLILKVFDVIEKKGHKLAEKIINNINFRYLLVSFSSKTLSGRPMRHPQRGWIERLLIRLNYKFKIYKMKKEIFYLAEKKEG